MSILFYRLRIFLILTVIFIGTGIVVLMISSKIGGHITINQTHNVYQDFIFKWITFVGDGIFVALGAVLFSLFYWKRYKISIVLLSGLNLILVLFASQFLKQIIYFDASRPVKFIGRESLYLVPDVSVYTEYSFPSGHTTATFAFFAFVAFMFPKKPLFQVFCGVMALLVGYSRIYLSQHFLEDVVAGAGLGIICFMLSYLIVRVLPLKVNITKER
ncbi:MAG: membrane-associated phospholipid phosphatase [Crocinitomicaceae bacterium]